jgi:hypothetical protein
MAVRALEQEGLDQEPESPEPLHEQQAAPPPDGDIEVLGTLVVDRVAEIVELRHALATQGAQLALLRSELDMWRTRALDEAALRKVEAENGRRRERELVSEIHRRMIEIDVLTAELAWRRLRWWHRMGRKAPATPAATAASAPR